jgi:hypothetical protein
MAGHFIVWRITPQDIVSARAFNFFMSPTLDHGPHANVLLGHPLHPGFWPGWTPHTRGVLNQARRGMNITNRNFLPPHKYLQHTPGQFTPDQQISLRTQKWVQDLHRPSPAVNFGLANLCPAALAKWNAGDRGGALIEQIAHGATSIEIYYLGRQEMM